MDIITKHTTYAPRGFQVTVSMDKDEVDTLVWALEAYAAKASEMQSGPGADRLNRDLKTLLEDIKKAYRRPVNVPDIGPQKMSDETPEERITRGFKSAGFILVDRHDNEVERGTLDECLAYLRRNHPVPVAAGLADILSPLGYYLRAI